MRSISAITKENQYSRSGIAESTWESTLPRYKYKKPNSVRASRQMKYANILFAFPMNRLVFSLPDFLLPPFFVFSKSPQELRLKYRYKIRTKRNWESIPKTWRNILKKNMWTNIIINFLLVLSVYLSALVLTVTLLTLWFKSRKRNGWANKNKGRILWD